LIDSKTILLTGASGFLGSKLLAVLISQGYSVVILVRKSSNLRRIEKLLDKIRSYDIDSVTIRDVFSAVQIDVVIHVACEYGRSGCEASKIVGANIALGLDILSACRTFGTPLFINSDSLLSPNASFYALSKKQFVEWTHFFSKEVKIINMKMELVYGDDDDTSKMLPWVLDKLVSKAPEIPLTNGEQKRDFIHVDDVVTAYLAVLRFSDSMPMFSNFEVGTGTTYSIRESVEMLSAIYKNAFGDLETLLNFGALSDRKGDLAAIEVNIKALTDLGWEPTVELRAGLERLVDSAYAMR